VRRLFKSIICSICVSNQIGVDTKDSETNASVFMHDVFLDVFTAVCSLYHYKKFIHHVFILMDGLVLVCGKRVVNHYRELKSCGLSESSIYSCLYLRATGDLFTSNISMSVMLILPVNWISNTRILIFTCARFSTLIRQPTGNRHFLVNSLDPIMI